MVEQKVGGEDDSGYDASNRSGDAVERRAEDSDGVLTLVCLTCGNEYYYSESGPPRDLVCEKCGGTVFRSFFSPEPNEAAEDFMETTDRDLDPDDAEGDTLPGDVLDLNRD